MQRLKSLDIRTAIVSSSANARSVLAAAGIAGAFGAVVDGNVIASEGLAGKPHPDPFLEAARRLGFEPGRCVVVEDAIAGVEAGRAGDFGLVVGVAREIDPERLREAGADVVVADLGELA
jgi:HAD superfamily hydrolase (TIGR01509 family)